MLAPPLEVGAVHETSDEPFAFELAVTKSGALGAVDGVAVVAPSVPVPDALMALTEKVYVSPFTSPVKVQLSVVVGQKSPTPSLTT
jgi:hypothetical protein